VTTSRIDTITAALRSLGGQARPAEIAEEIRRLFPVSLPNTLLQNVRGRIQECSSDSKFWKGKRDLFFSVHGIGGGVWGLRSMDPLSPLNEDGFADSVEIYMADEGTAYLRTHLRKERSKSLVELFKKQLISFACAVCDFDFFERYGSLGQGFIEAHHKVPVAQLHPGTKTTLEDLIPVCSNCHRMLHRSGNISLEELRAVLRG
jgi:putative restriction endonuclease